MWNKIWNINGTIQTLNTKSSSPITTNFDVYVNDKQYFKSKLSKFEITNEQSEFFTLKNPYFVACCAAYCATYMCGISVEHFATTENKLISTIAKYHFYYLMKKFLRSPDKLSTHMTPEHFKLIREHIPVKYIWKWEFDQTKERLDLWLHKKHRAGISVKDYYTTQSKYGGQIGIHYMQRQGRTYHSLNDYELFIAQKTNGLTALGQLLFQQSVESFVYSVLGAQASTRWPIVGQGAKSLQTQVVFRKIVNDTIIEDDQTVTISNMRKAIADTHVILNTAITPGMILVPGNLIILAQEIPGYNNILTVADQSMKFGMNEDINNPRETRGLSATNDPPQRGATEEHPLEDPQIGGPRNGDPLKNEINEDTNTTTAFAGDNSISNRNINTVKRSYPRRYYQTSYVGSTPVQTLTSVAIGAGALGFVGVMGYSLM